jgi:hypothetical protein
MTLTSRPARHLPCAASRGQRQKHKWARHELRGTVATASASGIATTAVVTAAGTPVTVPAATVPLFVTLVSQGLLGTGVAAKATVAAVTTTTAAAEVPSQGDGPLAALAAATLRISNERAFISFSPSSCWARHIMRGIGVRAV